MAITNYNTYKTALAGPIQDIIRIKSFSTSNLVGGFQSSWMYTPDPAPAAPTTAAVPSNTFANGGFGQSDRTNQRIGRVNIGTQTVGGLVLCDRLSHTGGLDATVTGAQSTNLSTSALTRYTSGVGVWGALEIYTIIGTTATTITVTYTDTDNNSATSPAIPFGGSGNREVARMIPITLAAGDVGIKSVQSVNLLASTTTAGAFGITLFKPLVWVPYPSLLNGLSLDALFGLGGTMPVIENGACLFWMWFPSANGQSSGNMNTQWHFIEDV